jgi:hypothetical protein
LPTHAQEQDGVGTSSRYGVVEGTTASVKLIQWQLGQPKQKIHGMHVLMYLLPVIEQALRRAMEMDNYACPRTRKSVSNALAY